MGIRGNISRSTIAYANENRDRRIYCDFAQVLIHQARQLYAADDFGFQLRVGSLIWEQCAMVFETWIATLSAFSLCIYANFFEKPVILQFQDGDVITGFAPDTLIIAVKIITASIFGFFCSIKIGVEGYGVGWLIGGIFLIASTFLYLIDILSPAKVSMCDALHRDHKVNLMALVKWKRLSHLKRLFSLVAFLSFLTKLLL